MQPGHHNQQLQPFGGGSTSAHSSPMKRAPQAVSPLASPMESRRVFMAHQQQHSGEQQQQQPPMGISALQLGYAMPTCRLLVDPQTGQQYFVPTAAAPAPHGMPSAAPTAAYFQPALFYNQPTAAFYPAHHQPHHPSVVTTSSPGYFYGAHQPPPVSSAAGYFAHQMNMNSAMQHQQQYQQQPTVPHHQMPPSSAYRSQSPMGREGQGQQAYRVEVPPSTVDGGSIYGEGGGVDERDSLRDGGYGHGQQQQQQFHRREQCRLSTESRGSSTRGGGGAGMFDGSPGETHSNPDECSHYGTAYYAARSPPPPPHHHQQLKPMPLPPPPLLLGQLQMTLSPGGGSSSESTSGFASGGRSRTRTFGDEPRSPQPPQSPLREQRGMFFPSQQHFRGSGEEEKHGREEQMRRRSPPPQPQQPRRAIRMDIDLSRPMSPPESASATRAMGGGGQKQLRNNGNGAESTAAALSVRATVLRTAPPTAFTISFNDDSHSRPSPSAAQAHQLGQVSISEVSLQEAAKQAPKGRRMMLARRSVPPRGQSGAGHDSGSECGGDPKQWLFRKMMMGRDQQQGTGSSRPGQNEGGGGVRGGRVEEDDEAGDDADHEDMASEAGTYVVDKQPPSAMTVTTRRGVESDSCSTSSSSSSTASPGPQPPVRPSFQASAGPKRSLMNDLRRLREIGGGNGGGQKQLVQQQQNKTVPMPMAQAAAAVPPKLPPPIPAQRKLQPQTVTTTTTSANANLPTSTAGGQRQQPSNRPCRANANVAPQQQQQSFRPSSASSSSTRCRSEPRTDGGRFSMRPTAHRPLPALQAGNGGRGPVPMRQQSANATGANKQPAMMQKSPEMLNWLRRKEYDPRKAAVTTAVTAVEQPQQPVKVAHQQQQQLRAQEAFMANRSLSAAVPSSIISGSATITKQQPSSAFSRWRSAQQGYGGGGEGGRAASLNRSHDDLSSRMGESLDEESLMGGQDSCTGSLQRTVDELTQKCHKSITLLKLCNQSALSPSVEQLLERVIQSGGESGAALAGAGDVPTNSSGQPRTHLAQAEGGENISDRLERLSSAFDAIQKYLEEQTSIGTRTMSGSGTFRKASANGNSGTSQAKLLDKSAMLGNNFEKKPGEN